MRRALVPLRTTVLVVAVAVLVVPSAGRPARAGAERYVVLMKPGAEPMRVVAAHRRSSGVRPSFVYRHALSGFAATLSPRALDALRADRRVLSVEPDVEVRAVADQVSTGVARVHATPPDASAGSGVHVAVLDTGIDENHPDLAGKIAGGTNCGLTLGGADRNGHGTHVAGIVAAAANGSGVVGVAPGASLWNVKVLNALGFGSMSGILCGLDFVQQNGPGNGGPIRVVNMSLSFRSSDTGSCGAPASVAQVAVCALVADGITLVAAAGNDGANLARSIPAAFEEVIAVTALADSDGKACGDGPPTSNGADDTYAGFSNFAVGSEDDAHTVGAPGVDIRSTGLRGTFSTFSGTSQASPHVAGAAARYIADHPGATPAQVLQALRSTGELPGQDFGGECGGGSAHANTGGRHPEPVIRVDAL